jgi:aminoglycoside phosphotransferase
MVGSGEMTLPFALQSTLSHATLTEVHDGMSGAKVLRVERDSLVTHYLKIATRGSEQDLQRELAVMLWLQGKLPIPQIEYFAEHGETQYLLMTGVQGRGLHDETLRSYLPEVIREYAQGLRQIHNIPTFGCPFDARLDVKIAAAQRMLRSGAVDADDFDEERQGRTAESLYEELLATRPTQEDLVFTHGDYCTPNVLIDPTHLTLTGFIDWGRAGIGDRFQDLGIAARSILYNYGDAWVAPFFEAYRLNEVDTSKIAFYRLLDEFF